MLSGEQLRTGESNANIITDTSEHSGHLETSDDDKVADKSPVLIDNGKLAGDCSISYPGTCKYMVTKSDAKKGTVKAAGVKGSKKSLVIADSIKIKGYTFKVTAIGAKAFKTIRRQLL